MADRSTDYYNATAASYEDLHGFEQEHLIALKKGLAYFSEARSVLDVGCGTGRGLAELHNFNPALDLHGIDPAEALLELAQRKVPSATLHVGTGDNLPFSEASFDVVVATGIMHHVENPGKIIAEMFRAARLGVIVSDHNNFAFGSSKAKRLRMFLRVTGLLGFATFVKQGFKKQGYSNDDGWWYPYSIFDNYADFTTRSKDVVIFPTRPATGNDSFLFDQSHVAIVGLK
jgi:ubiquinone/menaquinone biosynthesis C-methylase UbiE